MVRLVWIDTAKARAACCPTSLLLDGSLVSPAAGLAYRSPHYARVHNIGSETKARAYQTPSAEQSFKTPWAGDSAVCRRKDECHRTING